MLIAAAFAWFQQASSRCLANFPTVQAAQSSASEDEVVVIPCALDQHALSLPATETHDHWWNFCCTNPSCTWAASTHPTSSCGDSGEGNWGRSLSWLVGTGVLSSRRAISGAEFQKGVDVPVGCPFLDGCLVIPPCQFERSPRIGSPRQQYCSTDGLWMNRWGLTPHWFVK